MGAVRSDVGGHSDGVAQADPLVVQARGGGGGRVDEVAPVHEQRPRHERCGGRPVQAPELRPLRDQHRRVGAVEGVLRFGGDGDAGEQWMVAGGKHGIVRAHVRTFVDETGREDDGGRLTEIVGLRLEGEPEQGDGLAAQAP
jgi:hypothetical protein